MLVFRPLYLTLDSVVPATHFQRIQPALSIFINTIKITLSQALLSLQALLPLLWTKSR